MLNNDPLREAEKLLDEPLNEFADDEALEKISLDVEVKKGVVVAVGGKGEVRLAGRLVTILVEDVAEVDSVLVLDGTDEVICTLVTVDRTAEFEGVMGDGAGTTSVEGVGTDIEEISGRTEDSGGKTEVKAGTTEGNEETRTIEPLITVGPAEREVRVGTCDK